MPRSLSNVRFYLICFAALTLALPIAFISAAKLLLILCGLVAISSAMLRRDKPPSALATSWVSIAILSALGFMALSIVWSTGSSDQALGALTKHGRLLVIPVILYLTKTRQDALVAVGFLVGGQVFLLGSSWLLFLGVPLPWHISNEAGSCVNCSFATFSSYLDQSIMTAVLAAVSWHLRGYVASRYRTGLTAIIVSLSLTCVFFIFQGRTGHVVAIALITLAIAWESPKRLHLRLVLIPLALLVALATSSNKVSRGLQEIGDGIQSFKGSGQLSARSGIRLDLWRRSLQSIADNPWLGTGVGSWSREFKRQENLHVREIPINYESSQHSNPHQEYLLWGVELGLAGVVLLGAVLLSLYRDSLRLETPVRRALQSVLVALAIACLFNCTLFDALIGDFFCVTLALLLALGTPVGAPAPPPPSAV
jgi:O-antigen ligase